MSQSWRQLSKRTTAVLALAMFCWLNVLAVSPLLHTAAHSFLHAEAGDAKPCDSQPASSPAHQCAVTLISQGQMELSVPPVIPAAPTSFVFIPQPACVLVLSTLDLRLTPGRAPPVLPA